MVVFGSIPTHRTINTFWRQFQATSVAQFWYLDWCLFVHWMAEEDISWKNYIQINPVWMQYTTISIFTNPVLVDQFQEVSPSKRMNLFIYTEGKSQETSCPFSATLVWCYYSLRINIISSVHLLQQDLSLCWLSLGQASAESSPCCKW